MEENEIKWPQKDLPYEQQMKHVIQHYRWLLDQNEKLAAYAKKLEQKIEMLKNENAKKGEANKVAHERFVEKNRECKRLQAHIMWLEEQLRQKS